MISQILRAMLILSIIFKQNNQKPLSLVDISFYILTKYLA